MGKMKINAYFNPFRMKLSRKEPITLTVELENTTDEDKMLTMLIEMSRQLSFEKTGYKTEQMERLPKLTPGEKKVFYYSIFQKAGTKAEAQPVIVKVMEHYQSFKYINNEYTKNLVLKIED